MPPGHTTVMGGGGGVNDTVCTLYDVKILGLEIWCLNLFS